MKKTAILRKALRERRAVVAPGSYDALSAKIIEACGFELVQVSGFGIAGSLMGTPDLGMTQMKDILDITWNIIHAVQIPVMADADTGGGNAINAAWVCERLMEMGAAGMNLEDQVFPKRCGHLAGKEVIPADEMAGRMRACARVRDRLDPDFVLNARTDVCGLEGIDAAIARSNLYLEAGADLAFIEGIGTRADIEKAAREVRGLLSINLMDGVSGVCTELVPVPELAALGIARVSIPVASIMVTHKALFDFFRALKASQSGILAGQSGWLTPFDEYTKFLGLDQYRSMEDDFLPKERLRAKYRSHGQPE